MADLFVPSLTDQLASNGVVHLIYGFLFYSTDTSGELIEQVSYYSNLQESLAKVNLLELILGINITLFLLKFLIESLKEIISRFVTQIQV